jgi:hypothetical protein
MVHMNRQLIKPLSQTICTDGAGLSALTWGGSWHLRIPASGGAVQYRGLVVRETTSEVSVTDLIARRVCGRREASQRLLGETRYNVIDEREVTRDQLVYLALSRGRQDLRICCTCGWLIPPTRKRANCYCCDACQVRAWNHAWRKGIRPDYCSGRCEAARKRKWQRPTPGRLSVERAARSQSRRVGPG